MRGRFLVVTAILGMSLAGFGVGVLASQEVSQSATQKAAPPDATPKATIPAYHAEPPKGPLPDTMDPKQFSDPLSQNLYKIAADPKLKRVLYQQPCYCGCDKHAGHTSLLDCYVDRHATSCDVCRKEMVFANDEMHKGKTAAQIRQEIIDGKWTSVDLAPYRGVASPAPAER